MGFENVACVQKEIYTNLAYYDSFLLNKNKLDKEIEGIERKMINDNREKNDKLCKKIITKASQVCMEASGRDLHVHFGIHTKVRVNNLHMTPSSRS